MCICVCIYIYMCICICLHIQARTQVSSRIREVETVTELLDKMDREYRDLQVVFNKQICVYTQNVLFACSECVYMRCKFIRTDKMTNGIVDVQVFLYVYPQAMCTHVYIHTCICMYVHA